MPVNVFQEKFYRLSLRYSLDDPRNGGIEKLKAAVPKRAMSRVLVEALRIGALVMLNKGGIPFDDPEFLDDFEDSQQGQVDNPVVTVLADKVESNDIPPRESFSLNRSTESNVRLVAEERPEIPKYSAEFLAQIAKFDK